MLLILILQVGEQFREVEEPRCCLQGGWAGRKYYPPFFYLSYILGDGSVSTLSHRAAVVPNLQLRRKLYLKHGMEGIEHLGAWKLCP